MFQSDVAGLSKQKILIFRLSSLGDIVFATSVLDQSNGSAPAHQAQVDWVVAKEFAGLLEGHPRIRKLWIFDRTEGTAGWIRLCGQLWNEGYDSVFDLHQTLRTRLAFLVFSVHKLRERGRRFPRWKAVSKQRWRQWGFYSLRRRWPRKWRPERYVTRFHRLIGGDGSGRPDLTHLVSLPGVKLPDGLKGREYLCVMPGANWPAKCWPAERYFEVLKKSRLLPVILGTRKDQESLKLEKMLQEEGREHLSGIGKWSVAENAAVLAGATAYLGNDTGFAHLAEAVGTRSIVIYGPTAPDGGSAPWREGSQGIESGVWCHPCGGYGKRCYRIFARHQCLTSIQPEVVARAIPLPNGGPSEP